MCLHLGIVPIQATMPSISSPYYAGYFDADGTLGVYMFQGCPYLKISVTNKYRVDVELLQATFGGNISPDRTAFRWAISGRADVTAFMKYVELGYFQSFKSTKFL